MAPATSEINKFEGIFKKESTTGSTDELKEDIN